MLPGVTRHAIAVAVAATLLAVAVTPPGVRHEHELPLGNAPHDHDHDHDHDHEFNSHSHHADGGHDDADARAPFQLTGYSWHLHTFFLGITVRLPDSVPSGDDRHAWDADPEYVGPAQSHAVGALATSSALDTASFYWGRLPEAAKTLAAIRNGPSQATSPPLCDRARFERTGVLRA